MLRWIAAVCTLILLCACAGKGEPEVTRRIFEEGDRFEGYSVTDGEGRPVAIAALPGEERLVLYLSASCGDCIEEFESYALLLELYPRGASGLSILWQTAYPEKEAFPSMDGYVVPADLRLGDWVPTYFLLNGDGVILRKSIDLPEAFAAYAAQSGRERNEQVLAEYLGRTGTSLLLTDTAIKAPPEECIVVDCTEDGALGDAASLRDDAGILMTLSGVEQLPALLSLTHGRAVVVNDP